MVMDIDKNAILALDIGTNFVKALIAKPSKTTQGELEVLGIGRAAQEKGNMFSGAIADIEGCIRSSEKAIHQAEKQAGVMAKKVVVGIAGELVKGKTSNVHYSRKNSSRAISESEMEVILGKVQQKTGEEAREAIALESGNDNTEVALINSAIVSLSIDGLRVTNPIGFKGHELNIQAYTAFAPAIHVSAIEKVAAELSLDLIAVAVEPFAMCRALLGDEPDTNYSAIVMDIGSGTTDIAVIMQGGIEGTKTLNIGANAIDKNINIWLEGLNITLEDFDTVELLPSRVVLAGGGAEREDIQEALALGDWYDGLPFARRPMIEEADFTALPGYTNTTDKKLDGDFVTALGLLRVGLDTEQSAPATSIKDKIARILQN